MDRNIVGDVMGKALAESLSARRAWIEIGMSRRSLPDKWVALRKESVDRNATGLSTKSISKMSLSARRAWIEMQIRGSLDKGVCRRSPQGERG